MAELDPAMRSRLEQLIAANRAPVSGTWASPDSAPIVGVPAVQAAAPAPISAPAPVAAPPMAPPPAVQPPSAIEPAARPAPATFDESLTRTSEATAATADAIRAEGDARAQGLADQAELTRQQAAEQAAATDAFAKAQRERESDRDEVRNQLSFMQEQNGRLNQITDRRTTTKKVLGTLAIALSGVGDGLAAMGGNQNTHYSDGIVAQLNKQIGDDVDNQKVAIEGRNRAAAMKLTELGLANDALGDAQSAESFVTSQRQLRFATELKSQAAKSGSELARKEMLTAAAKLELDANEKQSALLEKLTEQKYRSRAIGGGAGGGKGFKSMTKGDLEAKRDSVGLTGDEAKSLKAIYDAEDAGRKPADTAEQRAIKAATDPVQAATEKGARLSGDLVVKDPKIAPLYAKNLDKTQAGIDSAREMVSLIDQALKIRKDNPVKSNLWGTDARGELQSIGTAIQLNGKNVFELGALSGPDMGLIEGIAGKPDSFLDINEAKLRQLRSDIIRGTSSKVQARGFEAPTLEVAPARGSAKAQADRVQNATTAPATSKWDKYKVQ